MGCVLLKRKGFTDIVYELDADIISLQEIKAMPEQLPESVRNLEGYEAYWFPAKRKGYAGVCIYTRIKPLKRDLRHGYSRA